VTRPTLVRTLLTAFFVLFLTTAGQGTASAAGLTVSGPGVIQRSGTYTYYADLHAFYQSYWWYARFCPTKSVSSCTATWSLVRNAYHEVGGDSYSRSLSVDCTGGGTRSFQLKVTASGFATPAETVYKVTGLCPDPLP